MEAMKYLIGIPCMGMVHTGFAASLVHLNRVGESKVTFLANALVYNARNMLCKEAIETGADRILFLDSDMVFGHDLIVSHILCQSFMVCMNSAIISPPVPS